jgi:hypothetical protein
VALTPRLVDEAIRSIQGARSGQLFPSVQPRSIFGARRPAASRPSRTMACAFSASSGSQSRCRLRARWLVRPNGDLPGLGLLGFATGSPIPRSVRDAASCRQHRADPPRNGTEPRCRARSVGGTTPLRLAFAALKTPPVGTLRVSPADHGPSESTRTPRVARSQSLPLEALWPLLPAPQQRVYMV